MRECEGLNPPARPLTYEVVLCWWEREKGRSRLVLNCWRVRVMDTARVSDDWRDKVESGYVDVDAAGTGPMAETEVNREVIGTSGSSINPVTAIRANASTLKLRRE